MNTSQCGQCITGTPIAQGEISMSVAFPTHVWKMPNICKYIIVWLFSHMCAFSRTYVLKSKHVWKKAPRCKYTNMFSCFQTCRVKVNHLEEDIPLQKMIGMIQNDHSEGVFHSRFSLPMLFHRT